MGKLKELKALFEKAINPARREEFFKKTEMALYELNKKIEEDSKLIQDIKTLRYNNEQAISRIVKEATTAQPWLAKAISDYQECVDEDIATRLKIKKHPAYSAAEQVRAISKEKKEYLRRLKEAEYKIAYYESLFPALTSLIDDNDDVEGDIADNDNTESVGSEINNVDSDEVLRYISKSEYQNLSITERNQAALDRYLSQRHSKSHIGKMYERYIGYLFERDGFVVEYFGIKKGLEDMGRDLICTKGNEIHIVQCKCWGKNKSIHENVICQLYGTSIKYKLDDHIIESMRGRLFGNEVLPVFITNIDLSDTASEFAKALGVIVQKQALDLNYPMIKCNINAGNKIYHLPFDQMYDLTYIRNKGECYVKTVAEAEMLGFRRANRHIQ